MNTSRRYSPEVRERAVQLVLEYEEEYSSQWAAIESISEKSGCTAETLRRWVRQKVVESTGRSGAEGTLLRSLGRPPFRRGTDRVEERLQEMLEAGSGLGAELEAGEEGIEGEREDVDP